MRTGNQHNPLVPIFACSFYERILTMSEKISKLEGNSFAIASELAFRELASHCGMKRRMAFGQSATGGWCEWSTTAPTATLALRIGSRAIKIPLVMSLSFQTSKQRLIDFPAQIQNIIWSVSVRWVQHVDLFPDPILSFTTQSDVCIKVRFRSVTLQASLGWISSEGEIPVKLWKWMTTRRSFLPSDIFGCKLHRGARDEVTTTVATNVTHAAAHSLTWPVNRDTQGHAPWADQHQP